MGWRSEQSNHRQTQPYRLDSQTAWPPGLKMAVSNFKMVTGLPGNGYETAWVSGGRSAEPVTARAP